MLLIEKAIEECEQAFALGRGVAIVRRYVACSNRVTVALKLAASNLRTSQSYLGAQFRRLRARLDTPVAIKAMAAKLARLIYRMLRYGTKYLDQGALFYETQQRRRQIRALKHKAAKLGFQLVQAPAA
jgi:transposase